MKLATILIAATGMGFISCGRFDYNAQEFKNASDSAKNFENLSDEGVMQALDGLVEQKMSAISTKDFREHMTRVIQAMVSSSSSVSPFSLHGDGGLQLSTETKVTNADFEKFLRKYVYDNPCKKYKITDDASIDATYDLNKALVDCHAEEIVKYVSMVRNMLVATRGVFGDATKVIYFLLEDRATPYAFDGTVLKDLAAPDSVRGLLPAKYKDYRVDLSALKSDGAAKKMRIRVKNGEGTLASAAESKASEKMLGYLTTINSEIVAADSAYTDLVAAHSFNYLVTVRGKETKYESASANTLIEIYLGFTPGTTATDDKYDLAVKVSNIDCIDQNPTIANAFGFKSKKESGSSKVYSKLALASDRLNSLDKCSDALNSGTASARGILWADILQSGVTRELPTGLADKYFGVSDTYYGADLFAVAMSSSAYDFSSSEAGNLSIVAKSTAGTKAISVGSNVARSSSAAAPSDLACIVAYSVFNAPKRVLTKSELEKAAWEVSLASVSSVDSTRPYWATRGTGDSQCSLDYTGTTPSSKVAWDFFFNAKSTDADVTDEQTSAVYSGTSSAIFFNKIKNLSVYYGEIPKIE